MSLHLNIEFKLSNCNYILLRGNQFHSTSDIETAPWGRKSVGIVAYFRDLRPVVAQDKFPELDKYLKPGGDLEQRLSEVLDRHFYTDFMGTLLPVPMPQLTGLSNSEHAHVEPVRHSRP